MNDDNKVSRGVTSAMLKDCPEFGFLGQPLAFSKPAVFHFGSSLELHRGMAPL
jgi:hypothetical protein